MDFELFRPELNAALSYTERTEGATSSQEAERPRYARDETMRRANNAKSKIRSRVEHVFAEQKDRMGHSSELSGSPEQLHDRLELRKATHSTQYPIAIRLNQ